jgi:hypothetical protein
MIILDESEAQARAIRCLGLDPAATDFNSIEPLAALVRRTASFCCPCSTALLARTVTNLLAPLLATDELYDRIHDAIDGVTAYGDLIEVPEIDGPASQRNILNLATPAVIRISSHRLMLIGIASEGVDPLPEPLASLMDFRGFARLIEVDDVQPAISVLLNQGFLLVSADEWNQLPRVTSANDLVAKFDRLLGSEVSVGNLEGLRVLLPNSNVRFYKGRWSPVRSQSGRFVARRERRFGSDLWCVVRLAGGAAVSLVDLPTGGNGIRGCDEAWHLQQAIDVQAGTPQEFRVRKLPERDSAIFDFFSPVPQWATRRWDILGERIESAGSLISYLFNASHAADEAKFAETRMWLKRQ